MENLTKIRHFPIEDNACLDKLVSLITANNLFVLGKTLEFARYGHLSFAAARCQCLQERLCAALREVSMVLPIEQRAVRQHD